jgi:hypothetical protein
MDGSRLDVGAEGGSLVGVCLSTAEDGRFDGRASDADTLAPGVAGRSELPPASASISGEGASSDSLCCFPSPSPLLPAVKFLVILLV